MSQKKRELRRKKKKKWRLILISFIFAYLFFRSVPSLFAAASKTVLAQPEIIDDKIQTEAIIIKNESLYKANGEGKLEVFSKEGERVAAGTKIAQLTLFNDNSTLKQELDEVDKKIAALSKTEKENEIVKSDEKNVEENIENIIKDIQKSISEGDYEKADNLKEKLAIYDGKQKDILGEKTLINQSLDSLGKQREELLKQISSNIINYFSKEAGIVSFKIDGYEEIYSFDSKDNYSYSSFKKFSDKQKVIENNKDIKTGEPIFKIIDNFEWYMIIKIENIKDISSYKKGDPILLTTDGIEGELKGYIEDIKKEGNKGVIVCKFNTDFDNYYDKRFINVGIIRYRHDGFKIPSESIIEKDGIKGAYIKEISGIVKFKPIEILKEEDKFTYISNGDKNNKIKIKGSDDLVKTVTTFDEILINAANVKEGMIIN
jgi:putative membrane fusion protein